MMSVEFHFIKTGQTRKEAWVLRKFFQIFVSLTEYKLIKKMNFMYCLIYAADDQLGFQDVSGQIIESMKKKS